jgi:hypothetical protein
MSRTVTCRLACMAMMVWGLSGSLVARDINVSLTGDDGGPGTRSQPYRTLSRAQAEARASRRDKPAEPVTVWINPGDWPLTEPLVLTGEDSGTPEARVLYRAVPRAVVRLTGGRLNATPDEPATPDPTAQPLVHLRGAAYLMLRGLTIEGGTGHGVLIQGGAENVVAGCKVRNVVGYGVVLDGGTRHAVQSCDIEDCGGGIWLSGGDEASTPPVSAGHRVINNHTRHLVAREGTTAAAINCGYPWLGGGDRRPVVGVHAAHNLIHDVPGDGILLGGRECVIEYNEVFRFGGPRSAESAAIVCREPGGKSGGIDVRFNLVHHGRDVSGIDLDAGCGAEVRGNVVCDLENGTGFRIRSERQGSTPPHVSCTNNVVVRCASGLEFPDNLLPAVTNNVAVFCPIAWATGPGTSLTKSSSKQPLAFGKNLAYDTDPGFTDVNRLDFRFLSGSPVIKQFPEFESIPLDRVGLSIDKYRTELPNEEILHRLTKP